MEESGDRVYTVGPLLWNLSPLSPGGTGSLKRRQTFPESYGRYRIIVYSYPASNFEGDPERYHSVTCYYIILRLGTVRDTADTRHFQESECRQPAVKIGLLRQNSDVMEFDLRSHYDLCKCMKIFTNSKHVESWGGMVNKKNLKDSIFN